MEEEKIEFFAKVKDWVCVKRGEVNENTDDLDVARILTSIQNSLDRKKWDFIGKVIDLKQLDLIATELVGETKRVNAEKLCEILAKANGPGTSRKIGNVVSGKKGKEVAKTYVTRQVFELLKFRIDLDSKLVEKFGNEMAKKKMAD